MVEVHENGEVTFNIAAESSGRSGCEVHPHICRLDISSFGSGLRRFISCEIGNPNLYFGFSEIKTEPFQSFPNSGQGKSSDLVILQMIPPFLVFNSAKFFLQFLVTFEPIYSSFILHGDFDFDLELDGDLLFGDLDIEGERGLGDLLLGGEREYRLLGEGDLPYRLGGDRESRRLGGDLE